MDHYQVLGVPRDASEADIKRAYRKLARKYHPDVSEASDAEARFKEIGAAYAVLKDPESRKLYDQYGDQWEQVAAGGTPHGAERGGWSGAGPHRGPEGGPGFRGFRDEQAYRDIFEDLFGGGRGSWHTQRRGEDYEIRLPITLERAYSGGREKLRLEVPEIGDDGRVRRREKTLNVNIPKGVVEGQRLRLSGQGGSGADGGEAGDLFAVVAFVPHPHFSAEGADIWLDLPVTASEAALGARIEVPTLGGRVSLKVPKGSKTDQVLRLKGRGLPSRKPGDQKVRLKVVAVPADSPDIEALYEQLQRASNHDPRAALGG